jgi:hypothetical protein
MRTSRQIVLELCAACSMHAGQEKCENRNERDDARRWKGRTLVDIAMGKVFIR